MSWLSRGARTSVPAFRITSPRRNFYQLETARWTRLASAAACQRPFSASSLSQFHNSRGLNFPRWLNSEADGKEKGKAVAKSQEDDAQLEGSENEHEGGEEESSPPSSSSSSDGGSDSSDSPSSPPEDSPPPPPPPPPGSGSITKQSVPETYPQVLALPIARRPLFPGFYKAVVVKNPEVVAAIKDMMKRGQPYIGAFLLKDDTDSDIITDQDSVYPVGVFAQITSVFSASSNSSKDGDDKEESLTAVLYPHRRIRMTELVKAGGQAKVEAAEEPQTVTPPETPVEQNLALGTL